MSGLAEELRPTPFYDVVAAWLRQPHCPENFGIPGDFDALDTIAQWNFVRALISSGHHYTAAATSIFYCRTPLQVDIGECGLTTLIGAASVAILREMPKPRSVDHNGLKEYRSYRHPLKTSHPGAFNKVNVYCDEIKLAIRKQLKGTLELEVAAHYSWIKDLYDDQAAATLIYAMCLRHYHLNGIKVAFALSLRPKWAKALSLLVKSMGCNSSLFGARLCEAETLAGRGVGDIDLLEESRYRCDPEKVQDVKFDIERLRFCVQRILNEELPRTVKFDSLETYWTKRWLWAVGGSHSKVVEKYETDKYVSGAPARTYRRAYLERTEKTPDSWSGVGYYTASRKLEAGKIRAIFAGDTWTYVAFNHLLQPVEKAWRGKRVLLDPGKPGHLGIVEMVSNAAVSNQVCVMADYDDFNSQHSNAAQAMVIEELIRHVGYHSAFADKLPLSFYRTRVFCEGRDCGYTRGTLMSGHRGTAFINSILNAAYMRYVLGDELYCSIESRHVGDDIIMATTDYVSAAKIMDLIRASPLRMNPKKQSVGTVGCEFLRMGIRNYKGYGYVTRAISGMVCGNWVSDVKLDPQEALRTMLTAMWTLRARSGMIRLASLLVYSIARVTQLPLQPLVEFADGIATIDGSPLFARTTCYQSYKLSIEFDSPPDESIITEPRRATTDYLSNHASDVERHILSTCGFSVTSDMLKSSYGKEWAAKEEYGSMKLSISLCSSGSRTTEFVSVDQTTFEGKHDAAFRDEPLLMLLRNRLSDDQVCQALRLKGVEHNSGNCRTVAFGPEAGGVITFTNMSYSDASRCCSLYNRGQIVTSHNIVCV